MPPSRDTSPDERALVAAARTGSPDALTQLYVRHAGAVFGVAYRLLGTTQDAEDVLQDVFVGLPEALQGYEERGTLGAWIRRIAARAALMQLRAQGRRREEAIESGDDVPAHSTEHGIVDRVVARDAVRRLPETLRTVFMLKEVEGYSHAEIAEMLGVTSGTSAVRLNRAWKALHRELLDR